MQHYKDGIAHSSSNFFSIETRVYNALLFPILEIGSF